MKNEPREITWKIALLTSPTDIFALSQVNKKLNGIIKDNRFWQQYYRKWVDPKVSIDWRRKFLNDYYEKVYPIEIWIFLNPSHEIYLYDYSDDYDKIVLVSIEELGDEYRIYPFRFQLRFDRPPVKSYSGETGIALHAFGLTLHNNDQWCISYQHFELPDSKLVKRLPGVKLFTFD